MQHEGADGIAPRERDVEPPGRGILLGHGQQDAARCRRRATSARMALPSPSASALTALRGDLLLQRLQLHGRQRMLQIEALSTRWSRPHLPSARPMPAVRQSGNEGERRRLLVQ